MEVETGVQEEGETLAPDLVPPDRELHKQCLKAYKTAIMEEKGRYYLKISESLKTPKELFNMVNSLVLPTAIDPVEPSQELCNRLSTFFCSKISDLYAQLETLNQNEIPDVLPETHLMDSSSNMGLPSLCTFSNLAQETVEHLLEGVKSGSPRDPCPLKVLNIAKTVLIPLLTTVLNLANSEGQYPLAWKMAVVMLCYVMLY